MAGRPGRKPSPPLLEEVSEEQAGHGRGPSSFFLCSSSPCLAPWIAPYDPGQIDIKRVLEEPYAAASLRNGSPRAGMCFSRMIWGSRISLMVGFVAVGIATADRDFSGGSGRLLRPLGGQPDHALRGHHALLSHFLPDPGRDRSAGAEYLEYHDRHRASPAGWAWPGWSGRSF